MACDGQKPRRKTGQKPSPNGQCKNVMPISSGAAYLRRRNRIEQEAQLSLTNRAPLFCKVVEVLQDFLSENVNKKFTTDYNVA